MHTWVVLGSDSQAVEPMRASRTDVPRVDRCAACALAQDLVEQSTRTVEQKVRRRSRVVGILPNAAAIRLIGAVLADQHDEWAIVRGYLSETSMAELDDPRDTPTEQPHLEG